MRITALIVLLLLALPVDAQEPTALDRALRAAEDRIAAGQSAQALDTLRELGKTETNDERIPFLMAQCEFNLWLADRKTEDHLRETRKHIAEAFRRKHPYPECSFLSGWIEAEAGNFRGAVKGYRGAIAGRFRLPIARQNLAFSYFHLGVSLEKRVDDDTTVTNDDVIDAFEQARERFRNLAKDMRLLPRDRAIFRTHWLKAWSNVAAMHQKDRNYPAAEKLVRSLIEVQPDNPFHYLHLGLILGDKREWEEAIRWYEKALVVGAPTNFAEPHLRLAHIYSRQDERTKAEEHFAKFFKAFPKSWEGHYERGRHYRHEKEYEKAIADFLRCVELDGEGYVAMKELSECYRLSGEDEIADEWAKKFKALNDKASADRAPPQPEEEEETGEEEEKGGK